MSKISTSVAIAVLGVSGLLPGTAQTTKPGPADRHVGEKLKMVVILSRHGVRSPTWTQARLDSYSALPWPQWSVPPADLTARGHNLLKIFGSFDRESLVKDGLLAEHGCTDAAASYVWADTDQRTLESGRALAEGLFPGCELEVHSIAGGGNDPLFHPVAEGAGQSKADSAFAGFEARVKQQSGLRNDPRQGDVRQEELIGEVQHLLLGCSAKTECKPAHTPEMMLTTGPVSAVRGKGDHIVDLQGPLAQASSLTEDFLLEYADGMPMSSVGWGNVDQPELRRLLALHTDYFDLMHRTPVLAQMEASNLLYHIERTLEQAVAGAPVADAIGPAGSKLVVIVGHDTNLAGIATLLGLHWHLDGRDDDTPPGTQLAFELWQDSRGAYSVHVTVAMQTLTQMREMKTLTLTAPPARERLTPQSCASTPGGCTWEDFQRVANSAVNSNDVFRQKLN